MWWRVEEIEENENDEVLECGRYRRYFLRSRAGAMSGRKKHEKKPPENRKTLISFVVGAGATHYRIMKC